MRRSFLTFILILGFAGLILGACSSDDPSGGQQKSQGPELLGSGDGAGGGNTCNGKPIESYAMGLPEVGPKINKHPAFIKYIKPVLDSFESHMGEDGKLKQNYIYLFLTYALENKNWYLIPCPIDPLAAKEIGAVVSTDQGASQTMDAIWFSTPALKGSYKKADKSFARLIVHEMLMGTRLLKFESAYTQCLIQAPPSWCGKKDNTRTGKASDLSEKDYNLIRSATNEFLSFDNETSDQEWADFMAEYFQIFHNVRFSSTDEKIKVTPQKIRSAIDFTQVTKSMPSLAYIQPWIGSKEKAHRCEVILNWNEEEQKYYGKVISESGPEFIFHFSLPKDQEMLAFPNERTELLEITLRAEDQVVGLKKGELVPLVDINFDATLHQLNSIFIKKIYCQEHITEDGVDRCINFSGPHIENYLCTNQTFKL